MKMPLRYFGSKWRLAPWIAQQFGLHRCYVEAFAGGASVLIRKEEAAAEVLNDLDESIVNFWRVLREHGERFVRHIELTPFSRQIAREALGYTKDPFQRAVNVYVQAHQLRAGTGGLWKSGWRYGRGLGRFHTPSHDWTNLDGLEFAVRRLARVQIENDSYQRVLARYDTRQTLFYLDPPYLSTTRGKWGTCAYNHEMSTVQHAEMLELIQSLKGAVVLSGYPSPLYDKALKRWRRIDKSVQLNHNDSRMKRTEVLWIKPA